MTPRGNRPVHVARHAHLAPFGCRARRGHNLDEEACMTPKLFLMLFLAALPV